MIGSKSKIALLICGSYPDVRPNQLTDWIKNLSELNIIAEVKPILIFQKSSTNIEPDLWLELYRTIKSLAKDFTGFVILHDTDNIIYTAAALSFLTLAINKPIILTSGQNINDQNKLESKANLINAIQSASTKANEVCLMFGNKLIRGNQAQYSQTDALNKFDAPVNAIFGRIDFGVRIFEKLLVAKMVGNFKPTLNQNILTIHLEPNLDYQNINQLLTQKQAVIINASHYQQLPTKLIDLLNKKLDLPIIICWSLNNPLENEKIFKTKNFISINKMTWPTTTVKTMWVLAQTKNHKKIKDLMLTNIAGEII